MRIDVKYQLESLLDDSALSESQRELVNRRTENQACDPCNCDESGCNCRCN